MNRYIFINKFWNSFFIDFAKIKLMNLIIILGHLTILFGHLTIILGRDTNLLERLFFYLHLLSNHEWRNMLFPVEWSIDHQFLTHLFVYRWEASFWILDTNFISRQYLLEQIGRSHRHILECRVCCTELEWIVVEQQLRRVLAKEPVNK